MSVRVTQYTPELRPVWNEFVARAKNGLFLFQRDYMDYHADRFVDASMLLWVGDNLVAVLPASRHDDLLISHGGLTFGGLLLAPETRAQTTVELLVAIRKALAGLGARALRYKQIPFFLNQPLSSEDGYALFRADAQLVRVDANFVIDFGAGPPQIQERRLRSMKKAAKAGVLVEASSDFDGFWHQVLEPTLQERHGVKPVHSVEEMRLLASRFPSQIQLLTAKRQERVVAGTVLYRYSTTTHAQYIAANDEGRENGALDAIFGHLTQVKDDACRFLSFGISTEDEGRTLNGGLAEWKEGFGARLVPHAFFEVRPLGG